MSKADTPLFIYILGLVVPIGYWLMQRGFDSWAKRRRRRFWRQVRTLVEEREASVFALTLEQARSQAEHSLLAGVGWKYHNPVGSPAPIVRLFAPSPREMFSCWERIERVGYDMELCCDNIEETFATESDSAVDDAKPILLKFPIEGGSDEKHLS